jgi:uncharacterized protein (TIGR02172 family)
MAQDLGQPIAYGRTAEVYSWHHGEVLKLFYDWFSLENIENEARISRVIHATGLPTPSVGEIIRINDRYGLVYERVYGESLWKIFQHQPWNWSRYTHRCVELQAAIHGTAINAVLPSQRQILESNIIHAPALSSHLRVKALSALKAMPDGNNLCHGDFWPGNILVTLKGEIIIDWVHASFGNPLADLARTVNLAFGFLKSRQIKRPFLSFGTSTISQIKDKFLHAFVSVIYPMYVNTYFKLNQGDRDEYRHWLPIVAAARLSDNIPELEKMLIAQVETNL